MQADFRDQLPDTILTISFIQLLPFEEPTNVSFMWRCLCTIWNCANCCGTYTQSRFAVSRNSQEQAVACAEVAVPDIRTGVQHLLEQFAGTVVEADQTDTHGLHLLQRLFDARLVCLYEVRTAEDRIHRSVKAHLHRL